jgi:hypothetical protein
MRALEVIEISFGQKYSRYETYLKKDGGEYYERERERERESKNRAKWSKFPEKTAFFCEYFLSAAKLRTGLS